MLLWVIAPSRRFIIGDKGSDCFIILLIQPIKANSSYVENPYTISKLDMISMYNTSYGNRWTEIDQKTAEQCCLQGCNSKHQSSCQQRLYDSGTLYEMVRGHWSAFVTVRYKTTRLAIYVCTIYYKVKTFVETTSLDCLGSPRRTCEGRIELHRGSCYFTSANLSFVFFTNLFSFYSSLLISLNYAL